MLALLSDPHDFWIVSTFKQHVSKFHDILFCSIMHCSGMQWSIVKFGRKNLLYFFAMAPNRVLSHQRFSPTNEIEIIHLFAKVDRLTNCPNITKHIVWTLLLSRDHMESANRVAIYISDRRFIEWCCTLSERHSLYNYFTNTYKIVMHGGLWNR